MAPGPAVRRGGAGCAVDISSVLRVRGSPEAGRQLGLTCVSERKTRLLGLLLSCGVALGGGGLLQRRPLTLPWLCTVPAPPGTPLPALPRCRPPLLGPSPPPAIAGVHLRGTLRPKHGDPWAGHVVPGCSMDVTCDLADEPFLRRSEHLGQGPSWGRSQSWGGAGPGRRACSAVCIPELEREGRPEPAGRPVPEKSPSSTGLRRPGR